jgi:hypothetical protein
MIFFMEKRKFKLRKRKRDIWAVVLVTIVSVNDDDCADREGVHYDNNFDEHVMMINKAMH